MGMQAIIFPNHPKASPLNTGALCYCPLVGVSMSPTTKRAVCYYNTSLIIRYNITVGGGRSILDINTYPFLSLNTDT